MFISFQIDQIMKGNHSLSQLLGNYKPISIQKTERDIFSNISLYCSSNEPAFQYCCEQACKYNAVTCQNHNCDCQKIHSKCDNFKRINRFHQKISSKIRHDNTNSFQDIQKNADKIIDKISWMSEQFLNSLKTFGLNKSEQNILELIKSHSQNKYDDQLNAVLTGQKLYKFNKASENLQYSWFKDSLSKYKQILSETKTVIQQCLNSIQDSLIQVHAQNNQKQELKQYFQNSIILSNLNPIGDRSKTFQSMYLKKILQQNMTINSVKKIFSYKSSEEQIQRKFDQKVFLKACQGKTNLLFMVENKYKKRFGALSSCKFQECGQIFKNAQKNRCFIFSLDNEFTQKLSNQKFGFRCNSTLKQIQIGQVFSNKPSINRNGFRLFYNKSTLKAELYTSSIVDQNKNLSGGLYGEVNKITYKSLNGVKNTSLDDLNVLLLEVYEIEVQKFLQQKNQNFKVQLKTDDNYNQSGLFNAPKNNLTITPDLSAMPPGLSASQTNLSRNQPNVIGQSGLLGNQTNLLRHQQGNYAKRTDRR